MLLPLCSPARNPDGSLVRPTIFEINAAESERLAIVAGAVVAFSVLLALTQQKRASAKLAVGLVILGALLTSLHPLWTVDTRSGDCGELQVLASWVVAGVQVVLVGAQLVLLLWRWDTTTERVDYDERTPRPAAR
jgi:protein-S-isoprenylcysteine O-methyltransferase Ste14